MYYISHFMLSDYTENLNLFLTMLIFLWDKMVLLRANSLWSKKYYSSMFIEIKIFSWEMSLPCEMRWLFLGVGLLLQNWRLFITWKHEWVPFLIWSNSFVVHHPDLTPINVFVRNYRKFDWPYPTKFIFTKVQNTTF